MLRIVWLVLLKATSCRCVLAFCELNCDFWKKVKKSFRVQTENFLNISNIVLLVISVLSLEPLKIEMCCSIFVNDIGI